MKNKCDFNPWPSTKTEIVAEPIPVKVYFPKTVEEVIERCFVEVDEETQDTNIVWNIAPELQAKESQENDQ